MLKNSDQVRPLTAAGKKFPFIKRCGCAAALILLLAAVVVTLASTVFRIRGPIVRIGNLTAGSLELVSGGNMTLNADVWVRNPNFESIEFGNLTTTVFYRRVVVGESRVPAGTARARRTVAINASMEIMTDRILSQPDLAADIASGLVNVSSYTAVGGKIDLGIFEKRMAMKMSCNVSVNVTSKRIQQHKCKRKIKL